jgi:hypothetical protein
MKVQTLLHKNGLYKATEMTMNGYQLAYLANDSFKRQSRLKRPSEDENIYNDIVKHTTAMPVCRYVVDTVNDVVFEPGIKRQLQFANPIDGRVMNPESQDWSELFQLDADLTNTSLSGVMENLSDLTSIFGHAWCFVDMPEAQPGYETMIRPYVVPVSPLNVWDYELKNVRGVMMPEYIKVLERETPDCYYFKCYFLGTKSTPSYWECYEVEKDENHENDVMPHATGTFPLGMSIPAFLAFTKRDPRRFDLGISDIDIATDVQREVYKLETEAYASIQFARSILRVDPSIEKVPAFAGGVIQGPEGSVESISIDQQDVITIIEKQQDLLNQFQALSGFGGLSTSSKQVQSGVAIIQERKQLHRMAKAKSRLMEIAEEQIWTFASRFMGVRWAGEIIYGTDYEQGDTGYRIALMEKAKALAGDNPIIQGMIVKQLVELLAPPTEVGDYVEAAITSSNPETTKFIEEEAGEIYTRDIGDQVPEDEPGEIGGDSKRDMEEDATENSGLINYTGQSYTTEGAIAVGLGYLSTGR